ncbi:SagB/ThcOx family dehydrogenase [Aeropyrum camini]|uniref:Nitroreductase n=1 Tax=Aeropyrum camini SY1 = JCM 12091 TaxID=1198449 RepID=U3T8J7_9CREN|nr:SagB/ThcOx family dehydrogenase [Aeropyrum camini]BAN89852.1 nitroreductase [Aeropyrum camini SY1 = JCM 12091]
MEDLCRLVSTLYRRLSSAARRRLLKGLGLAVERGDPALVYHSLSTLARDYYGDSLPYASEGYYKTYSSAPCVGLPEPARSSGVDVLEAIRMRRSRRSYSQRPLTAKEVSTLLFHVAGITGRAWWGGPKRPYPSAGALQPVEVYLVVERVEGLKPGLYHYNPAGHCLEMLREGRLLRELADVSLGQDHVADAAAALVLTAVYTRTGSKYGHRSYRYVHWDTGFAGENLYLVCEALGLATVAVGAFYDEEMCSFLGIECPWEMPMLVFPVGARG